MPGSLQLCHRFFNFAPYFLLRIIQQEAQGFIHASNTAFRRRGSRIADEIFLHLCYLGLAECSSGFEGLTASQFIGNIIQLSLQPLPVGISRA